MVVEIAALAVVLIGIGWLIASMTQLDRKTQAVNSRLADINAKIGYSADRALVESLRDMSESQRRFSDTLLDALMTDREDYRLHKINQSKEPETAPHRARTYDSGTLTPTYVASVRSPDDTVG